MRGSFSSLELLYGDAYGFFKLSDASLHLQESRVGRIGVIIEHVDLPV